MKEFERKSWIPCTWEVRVKPEKGIKIEGTSREIEGDHFLGQGMDRMINHMITIDLDQEDGCT